MASGDAAALRERYDVLVIGSGIGGLTAAALLARGLGKRVLVLEKHWTLGGQTHEFSRPGGWHWDVGLHYVGEMQPGTFTRRLMDAVTGARVVWAPMPHAFDRFRYPDLEIEVPADPREYERELCALFPSERGGLRSYFRDVVRASGWARKRVATRGMLPEWLAWPIRAHMRMGEKLALQTTGQWLGTHIRDPKLRAVLASQWGDYGLPPARSAFAIHALIVSHYFRGALYPLGGAQGISEGARAEIEARGGRCLVGAEALRILVRDGHACGARVRMHRQEEEVHAPVVVSNVGAHLTFRKLLEAPLHPELEQHLDGLSAVSLYLGLRESPATLGIDGSNQWIYDTYDHDALACAGVDDPILHVYLSFPSMKGGFEPHTAEVVSFLRPDAFDTWRSSPWKRRGPDYEALKERLSARMLALVESRNSGFSRLIEYGELSTPLSLETFTSRARGLMYGVPATPERFRLGCLEARTQVPGLYLSGSDVGTLGIVGAMFGGLAAASAVAGPTRTLSMMRTVFQRS